MWSKTHNIYNCTIQNKYENDDSLNTYNFYI